MGRVAAVAGVAEHLRSALEQRAGAVRLVGRRVEEMRVVDPDVRGGEAVFLEDLLEEVVGFLLRRVSILARMLSEWVRLALCLPDWM